MKVAGKNVVVFIKVGDDWVLYACATSATLNVTTEVLETSVSGNGKFASFIPTKNSFTGTLEGVTSLEESPKLSLYDLRQRQLAQELLRMKYQRTDSAGNLYTDEASFYIISSSDVGSFDDMNNFSIEMQGTGILEQSIESNPPDTPGTFDYYYGTTNLDTLAPGIGSYTHPTKLTMLASVSVVFIGGSELTGTETEEGNVEIEDFGSDDYKVVFMQYPKTEEKFTKWSEDGNVLQQNQLIDEDFVWGSGAVFFQTERDGDWIIIGYYQTKFAGTIIFHR